MKQRLQKILSSRGVASRRKAEEMMLAGRIHVNGLVASLGDSADPETDEILVDGNQLPSQEGFVYIMLHKPRGFVTTLSDERGRPNAAQLVEDCGTRVYPIGRLDMDSEGLLLFTNDGEFANRLMHPSHEIDKTYDTWVTGYSEDAEQCADEFTFERKRCFGDGAGFVQIAFPEKRSAEHHRQIPAPVEHDFSEKAVLIRDKAVEQRVENSEEVTAYFSLACDDGVGGSRE